MPYFQAKEAYSFSLFFGRLEHLSSPGSFSFTPNDALDPCAKESIMSALKESRKRAMIEEEEENLTSGQDSKRR